MAGSLTDRVVDGVRAMILDGRLRPGDRLPVEAELAAALGVSRGPLREGVRALSLLGVLESRQGAGTYVTDLRMSRLIEPLTLVADLQADATGEQLHHVRRVLEAEAAALAAGRRDPDLGPARAALARARRILVAAPEDDDGLLEADLAFHRAVAEAAGNPALAGFVDVLAGQTVRARLWRARVEEGVAGRTVAEHEAVLRAVEDGDAERARLRMSVHLLEQEDFLRAAAGPLEGNAPDQ